MDDEREIAAQARDLLASLPQISKRPEIRTPDSHILEIIEPLELKKRYYEEAIDTISSPESPYREMPLEYAALGLHKIVTQGVDWDALRSMASDPVSQMVALRSQSFQPGAYRDIPIRSGGDADSFDYLSPKFVTDATQSLLAKADGLLKECSSDPDDLAPQILATWVYVNFESIHPFIEAYGRVGELIADLMCLKTGRDPIRLSPDQDRINECLSACSEDPVKGLLSLGGEQLIESIKGATLETISKDQRILELTVAFMESVPREGVEPSHPL